MLPPVNYVIQKSNRSRPFVAHVDKFKPWHSDDQPKSWLSDGNGGANPDADPGLVNTGSGIRPSDNVAPGMDAVGAPGVDVTVVTQGSVDSNREVVDEQLGRDAGGVTSNDLVVMAQPGQAGNCSEMGLGNSVAEEPVRDVVGQLTDGGRTTGGDVCNDGVGPGRYTSGPNYGVVGAGIPGMIDKCSGQTTGVREALIIGSPGKIIRPGSVAGLTASEAVKNAGDGQGRYISGPNDGDRPPRYKCGHDYGKSADVQVIGRGDFGRDARESTSADRRHRQRPEETRQASDGAAIAGDPLSSTPAVHRPRRTTYLPERFNDFKLL